MKKLRIGLLLDDRCSSKYVSDLAEFANKEKNLEITHLIIISPKRQPGPLNFGRLRNGIANGLFIFITKIESVFLKFSKLHRHHFEKSDLGTVIGRQIVIHPTCGIDAVSYQFPEFDVKRVSALDLDLMIRFGSGPLAGDILHAARLGVIAYNNVSDQLHGKDHSGFWECYEREPKTGFAIRTLSELPEDGKTLLSGFFPTYFSFSLNQANMYRKSSPHFHDLLRRIAASGELPQDSPRVHTSVKTCRTPNVHECAFYLFKVLYRLTKKAAYRSVNFKKKWGLTFVHSNWMDVNSSPRHQVTAPKGHFWADPFVYAHNGRTYCFVEDYVYKTGLGHIAVLEVSKDAVVHVGDCIKEPFHLSFPFLFHYAGSLYMCPEASASRMIRLYRCVDFPLQWEPSAVIMDDVSAADSMLVNHSGLWWMLTSIDKSGSDDYTSELYLFYADSPLSQDWTAHPGNPIYIDAEGGRNAGLIMEEGKIYRLAQRQGYDQYGKGLLMFEVTELTKFAYSEHQMHHISPLLGKSQIGTHHLSTTGAVTVFDHVSRAFSP